MIVRPAAPADLPALTRIDRQAQAGDRPAGYWADELARPHARVAVLADGDTVLGFTATWWIAGEVELHDIVVDVAARGRGLGRRLLAALLAEAGAQPVFLEVRADNVPARALYARAGFSETGIRRRYYADGTDAVLYAWSGSAG